jgi:thymidylate synthase (FAD)
MLKISKQKALKILKNTKISRDNLRRKKMENSEKTEKIENLETVHGIEYTKPKVYLLQDTGIGVSELSARTCYDSFENSENDSIKLFNSIPDESKQDHKSLLNDVNYIEHSDLLDTLAWTHFHHSILEHANLSYLIKGTSRGVLQEHARHRIQAISVRSTRYTMSGVINAFLASQATSNSIDWFVN